MPLSMRPALTAEGRPALGFLFFVLALHSPSEVPNPLAEPTAQLGDTARAQDEGDDDGYEGQLPEARTEHERLPPIRTAQSAVPRGYISPRLEHRMGPPGRGTERPDPPEE